MKTPEEMAEERCGKFSHDDAQWYVAYEAWLDGYKAAKAIVEEELQAVQALRAESPGLKARSMR